MKGGVVFRVQGTLHFLPATIARKVLPMPSVARVPGAPLELVGVALVDGETIPVVALADLDAPGSVRPRPADRLRADNRPLLVCSYHGETVGLVGLEILATGRFDAGEAEQDVVHEGMPARVFDVGAVIGRLREGRWAV